MILTKKHINGLFDVPGSDGSWAYQLIDVRDGELLFYVLGSNARFEIESGKHHDWRRFKPQLKRWNSAEEGWKTGRRS